MQTLAAESHDRIVRELVLVGEDGDPERRGDKRIMAVSHCRFECPDDETLTRCVEAIRASDEHLRQRPEEMMLWDWQSTFIEQAADNPGPGGTVVLGVAWYDAAFFADKAEAHLDAMHRRMYDHIGLQPGAISVTHWRLEGEFNL